MKNFSYKHQPSILNVLKEPPKQTKKFNLDRSIFIAIISLLVICFIRFLVIKLAFIEVDGQISLEKLNVNFTNDIRLSEIWINESESVKAGDTLFSYVNNVYNESSVIERQIKEYDQISKNKVELQFEIQKLEIDVKKALRQLELLRAEHKKSSELVLLDIMTAKELGAIQDDINKAELHLWHLRQELDLKNNLYLNLRKTPSNMRSKISYSSQNMSYYITPIEGLIGQINFSPNEVCYETQSMLTIHNTEKVNIKAYFNQEALQDLDRGTRVEIEFPDGSQSSGFISNISVATYELPSEFQKKYEPTQRSILATVEPQNNDDLELWKRFYKMNVKVSINLLF